MRLRNIVNENYSFMNRSCLLKGIMSTSVILNNNNNISIVVVAVLVLYCYSLKVFPFQFTNLVVDFKSWAKFNFETICKVGALHQ